MKCQAFIAPAFSLLALFLLAGCALYRPEYGKPVSSAVKSDNDGETYFKGTDPPLADSMAVGIPAAPEAFAPTSARMVDVYYATTRMPSEDSRKSPFFLGEPSSNDNPIGYGRCIVSIPTNHKTGIMESPRWWKFEFKESEDKHVVVRSNHPMDHRSFFRQVNAAGRRANFKRQQGKQALIFIHGFNTSFENAIRRTGQLAWDLDFPGVPLSFSWPSAGSLASYTSDGTHADLATDHLARFLVNLQQNGGMDKIHIIAHSMGNRVLTGALLDAKAWGHQLDLNQIVLAAPDIGAEDFKARIMPRMKNMAKRITLYANSNDKALQLSTGVYRNSPRLGQSGENILVMPGLDTIDATQVDRSFVGHGYFGGNSLMLRDMIDLVVYNEAPTERRLRLQPNGSWKFFR